MKPFDHQPERYQPTGGISGDGIQNQLGRPRLDRLTLLVRESIQNSWDARVRRDGGSVRYSLSLDTLSSEQAEWLLETIFKEEPGNLGLERLASEPPLILTIGDRGTVGLAGPTRADEVVRDKPSNFVNLLRHVGRAPKTFRNGGTYGFGKTALFLASQVRTLIAYSQFRDGSSFNQRLIGAAVGSEYEDKVGRKTCLFTGRHWWGRLGDDDVVEPLEGRDAVAAARKVGLVDFGARDTGTTLVILLPNLEGNEPEEAMRIMSEGIVRFFWPKMIDGPEGGPSIRFDLRLNGRRAALPAPEDVPPVGTFVRAFENARAYVSGEKEPHGGQGEIADILCHRPSKALGVLSLIKTPTMPRLPSAVPDPDGPFDGPAHHVALLRGPHFVVRYLAGPPVAFDQAEYAGVFLASDEAEEAFARSEPPTHDDWSPDMLSDKNERTFVRVTSQRIKELLEDYTGRADPGAGRSGAIALGAFSDMLGGLLPTAPGYGARVPAVKDRPPRGDGGGRGGGGAGRPPAAEIIATALEEDDAGDPVLLVSFDVGPDALRSELWVRAVPSVMLEEGALEVEPPQGADSPKVLRWRYESGKVLSRTPVLRLPSGAAGPFQVEIAMPKETAISVDLITSREEP